MEPESGEVDDERRTVAGHCRVRGVAGGASDERDDITWANMSPVVAPPGRARAWFRVLDTSGRRL